MPPPTNPSPSPDRKVKPAPSHLPHPQPLGVYPRYGTARTPPGAFGITKFTCDFCHDHYVFAVNRTKPLRKIKCSACKRKDQ